MIPIIDALAEVKHPIGWGESGSVPDDGGEKGDLKC